MNDQQEIAKQKAIRIITSCLMLEHLEVALNYINLFNEQFANLDDYEYLIVLYNLRKESFINGETE